MNEDLRKFKEVKNDVIVFSHLRWEFVFQRPQHLLTRLSKERKILFIEEPIGFDNSNKAIANIVVHGNITVLQPRIDRQNLIEEVTPIVKKYSSALKINDPILWFYSPEFVEIVNKIDAAYIIYDCMDQLTAFKGAPPQLLHQEQDLLRIADVVFTGGKSIYDEKKKYNKNTYCLPSSVDRKHFEKANSIMTSVPNDIKRIIKPIVGYFGVIDERIDQDLLKQVSELMPDISFVMIGPVIKISEDELAGNKNIYYLGGKDYSQLPNYLKKIDIAMMPFALNESTRFISPTKTLEYMAAGKPIISTKIKDVERYYSAMLDIVSNAQEFKDSINKYLKESQAQAKQRLAMYDKVLNNTSWDRTATFMQRIIEEDLSYISEEKEVDFNKNLGVL